MSYKIERYRECKRFNEQYKEIYQFLLANADKGYNEHFHWGRFEWMMCHSFLEIKELEKIALFRDENNILVGLVTYDTCYDDQTYLLHSVDDKKLLKMMIDFAVQNYKIEGKTRIKANQNDVALNEVLAENGFVQSHKDNSILEMDLQWDMNYVIPQEFTISSKNFEIDDWKYQMVLHKGFDNEGIPEKWDEELLKPTPNLKASLKVFALKGEEYCAHCGVWYTQGETAYIEPVVTIPEYRKMGLAKAVVYEAISRAKELGAKRVVVLSWEEFYYKIGFEMSSEVCCWEKE
ncbi:MAG: GNAT family N-acetyltransferase [Lachnospiraceae bacterium]|nr:GNAT family N-acetyltransferase [Lachnospiraceae bacterium]